MQPDVTKVCLSPEDLLIQPSQVLLDLLASFPLGDLMPAAGEVTALSASSSKKNELIIEDFTRGRM